jgi:hypothetical protein
MDRVEVKSCHGRASLSMQVTSRASGRNTVYRDAFGSAILWGGGNDEQLWAGHDPGYSHNTR